MIEEIAKSLYKVEVPLPNNPLKSVNSYFIKDPSRNLIIDTGLNLPECKDVLLSAIEKLHLDLNKTDFFITHLHADHLDLAAFLTTKTSKIFLNQVEATILNNQNRWDIIRALYLEHGFPEEDLQKMGESHLVQGFINGRYRLDFKLVNENEMIQIGDYTFQCISTPGHSPGHMCLYEPDKKILFSGDHILFDITPNITNWPNIENTLQEYLLSLDKIYPLDVNLVLPGHRMLQNNHRKRILELKEHHRARANEILAAMDIKWNLANQIAPFITWDVSYKSWAEFPTPQKFYAVGEVIAHLKYLESKGKIQSKLQNGQLLFSRRIA
jgi:glyoxylase-like metal-dependent hydrolase (beta-lactamase superfamily II)